MRILTLSCEFPPLGGGGAQVVHGLSKTLVELGHEVDVVTMGCRGLPERATVSGIRVHRVRCMRASASRSRPGALASYIVRARPVVRELASRRHYDVNHTHFIFPDGVLARLLHRASGLPYVITAHGSDVPGYDPYRFRLLHALLRPFWHRVVSRAETVVSPSRSLQALIQRAGAACRTMTIPFGVDTPDLRADRAKHDRILVVGRLRRRAGLQYLLRAVDGIADGYTVHVVGDGPYRATLERLGQECDAPVVFHGWLDHTSSKLALLYESSRIFVLPSEPENFPMVLLEAMSAGDAVVTTASTACAEIVADAGILVQARDESALSSALVGLMRDPDRCAELGRRARRRTREHFAWEVIAERYASLFRSVAGRPRRPGDGTPPPWPRAAVGEAH